MTSQKVLDDKKREQLSEQMTRNLLEITKLENRKIPLFTLNEKGVFVE